MELYLALAMWYDVVLLETEKASLFQTILDSYEKLCNSFVNISFFNIYYYFFFSTIDKKRNEVPFHKIDNCSTRGFFP